MIERRHDRRYDKRRLRNISLRLRISELRGLNALVVTTVRVLIVTFDFDSEVIRSCTIQILKYRVRQKCRNFSYAGWPLKD